MFTKQADTYAGGLGDFGVLSFGPSKPLASIGGGALIAPKEWLRQKQISRWNSAAKWQLTIEFISEIKEYRLL